MVQDLDRKKGLQEVIKKRKQSVGKVLKDRLTVRKLSQRRKSRRGGAKTGRA